MVHGTRPYFVMEGADVQRKSVKAGKGEKGADPSFLEQIEEYVGLSPGAETCLSEQWCTTELDGERDDDRIRGPRCAKAGGGNPLSDVTRFAFKVALKGRAVVGDARHRRAGGCERGRMKVVFKDALQHSYATSTGGADCCWIGGW